MNLFIPTCLVLLVILAGMHYMAKVKSENLGPFFKWIGYLVLLAAACVLLGIMFKGVKKISRYGDRSYKERSYMDHRMKRSDGMKGHGKMGARGSNTNCGMMDQSGCYMRKGMGGNMCCCCCCDMTMMQEEADGANMKQESTIDTVDGKIIRKEIRTIEKEK